MVNIRNQGINNHWVTTKYGHKPVLTIHDPMVGEWLIHQYYDPLDYYSPVLSTMAIIIVLEIKHWWIVLVNQPMKYYWLYDTPINSSNWLYYSPALLINAEP